jgi:hypothetical protein
MFEDGIYVSYFSKDTDKKKTPQSVIKIENQRVSVGVNSEAAEDVKASLHRLAGMAESQKDQEYDAAIEAMLARYFEWNGYTPKPSDFFELTDKKGQDFTKIDLIWTRV